MNILKLKKEFVLLEQQHKACRAGVSGMGRGPGVEVGDSAGPSHTEPCRPRKDWGFYTKGNRPPPEGLGEESVTRSDGQFKSPLQLPRGEWITGTQAGKGKGREEAATVVPARRDASLGVSQVLLEETQEVV